MTCLASKPFCHDNESDCKCDSEQCKQSASRQHESAKELACFLMVGLANQHDHKWLYVDVEYMMQECVRGKQSYREYIDYGFHPRLAAQISGTGHDV